MDKKINFDYYLKLFVTKYVCFFGENSLISLNDSNNFTI